MSECLHIRKFLHKNREWCCKDCEKFVRITERDKYLKELDRIEWQKNLHYDSDLKTALESGDMKTLEKLAYRGADVIRDKIRAKYDKWRCMPVSAIPSDFEEQTMGHIIMSLLKCLGCEKFSNEERESAIVIDKLDPCPHCGKNNWEYIGAGDLTSLAKILPEKKMSKYLAIIDYLENDPEAEVEAEPTDVRYLKADSLVGATLEVAELMEYYGCVEECYMESEVDEFPVQTVKIIEIKSEHKFDLKAWFEQTKKNQLEADAEYDRIEELRKKQEEEENDRKEFERLKKKLEKK